MYRNDEFDKLEDILKQCRRCGSVAVIEDINTHTSRPVITENGREKETSKLYFIECSGCHVKTGLYHASDVQDMRDEWENAQKLYAPKNHILIFKYTDARGCGIESAKKVEIYRGGAKISMTDEEINDNRPCVNLAGSPITECVILCTYSKFNDRRILTC